jgi:SulP family sulfate permease
MASPIERHDPDKELFGQGLANLISPIMGGMPATAAIARTAAGISSGGNSRITGVVHSLTVLVATVALGGLAGHIPLAVLAAILIVVAWNIADVPEFVGLLRRAPRKDVIILVATVLVTVFLDLTYAIALGVAASAVLLLHQLTARPSTSPLEPDDSGHIQQVSQPLSDLIQSRPDISFFTVQGILSFHSVAAFEYALTTDISRPLILRMKDVHHIVASGLLTLESVIEHRHKHGARIVLTAIQPEIYPVLERFGIFERLGPDNFFAQTRDAIYALETPTQVH